MRKLKKALKEPLLEFWARCILTISWLLIEAFVLEIVWPVAMWFGRKMDLLIDTLIESFGKRFIAAVILLLTITAAWWLWQADFNLIDLWSIVKSWFV